MKKGIDISYCQPNFDLAAAKKEGVEFVIIRAGCSTSIDTKFCVHTENAIKAGLPYGFYWYSRAFSAADAKKEAEACLQTIKPYKPTYPVYYDMEQQDQIDKLDKATRTAIITTFCDAIKAAGYTPGIYLNPSWLENYVDKKALLDKYDLWLACWTENPDVQPKYQYGQKVWQWGLDKICGQKVDGDVCLVDYEQAADTPADNGTVKLGVGDMVQFTGNKHYGSSDSTTPVKTTPGPAQITKYVPGTPHPYHVIHTDNTSTVYGWVDASDIEGGTSSAEAETKWKPEKGHVVIFTGDTHYGSSDAAHGIPCIGGRATITQIAEGARHPYHLIHTDDNGSTVYGWVDADTFTKA